MKKLILAVLLSSSFSVFANAPLLTASSSLGFVPANAVSSENCQVFSNKVVITKVEGEISSTTVINVTTKGLEEKIAKAKKERAVLTTNNICDAPSTTIKANLDGEETILYSTGGCGAERVNRTGPATKVLNKYIFKYCRAFHI